MTQPEDMYADRAAQVVTEVPGGIHDGQWDPPRTCTACGARNALTHVTDETLPGRTRIVCLSCLKTALQSLGPGVQSTHIRACVAHTHMPGEDPYGVVAVWPYQSFAHGPYWLACVRHLREALNQLATERASVKEQP